MRDETADPRYDQPAAAEVREKQRYDLALLAAAVYTGHYWLLLGCLATGGYDKE